MEGWTYCDEPKVPTVSVLFGVPEFSYSTTENGEFTTTQPTDVGRYYVKAEVKETASYTGVSKITSFNLLNSS